jgi:preprotein translocase subunit SecE
MARTQRRRVGESVGAAPSSVRENLPRPRQSTPPPEGTSRPVAQPQRRRSPLAFLGKLEPKFVADVISELRKVTWPSFSEVRYLTIVVAIVAVAMGAFLGGLDLLFGWIIEQLFF